MKQIRQIRKKVIVDIDIAMKRKFAPIKSYVVCLNIEYGKLFAFKFSSGLKSREEIDFNDEQNKSNGISHKAQ